MKLDGHNDLQERTQWKLTIQCEGAMLDDIIPTEQGEKLKSYQKELLMI